MYDSLKRIQEVSRSLSVPFWRTVMLEDCNEEGFSEEESMAAMMKMVEAMKESVHSYDPARKSASGLIGGEAALLEERMKQKKMIAGDFMAGVMDKALRTASNNACMKRIVAAPTAGSCGVLPAVLLTYQEYYQCSDTELCEALYTAAGIGGVIGHRASLAGAEGGCQAEIGSASAMAAGALAHLDGGDGECIVHAAALALKGLLGLACDPVGGLVEIPCVKRNVIGAVNAVSCADMALAGIRSKIDPDQVIDAMRSIGAGMSSDIRETGVGGLAGTPDARAFVKNRR
jgi:L-serine dehydratase